MKYIATFDIGTTAIKAVLVSHDRHVIYNESMEITTLFDGDYKEQDPNLWYDCFCRLAQNITCQADPADITGIIMSGQMQDVILLDSSGIPVRNAILYSDARAASQVGIINETLGEDVVKQITGNPFDASIPFAKLLWLKENDRAALDSTHKIVISSKDAIIARLCGTFITDTTSASTSGLMDLTAQAWREDWLTKTGITTKLLPRLLSAHEEAGRVHLQAAVETGFTPETPVYAGTGDAGSATLASGISHPGEYSINLGTTGWIAAVSQNIICGEGIFNLSAMPQGYLINVVPFFNAGNVHKWICGILSPEEQDKYNYGNCLLAGSVPGSHGLYCLPYLAGERFPIVDNTIKGAYIGATPETSKQDFIRASLEGVAYSIRQGMDNLKAKPKNVSVIGGGAQVEAWCQLLSEVLGISVEVYKNTEFAPALAIASAALIAQKAAAKYEDFTSLLKSGCTTYNPIQKNIEFYQNSYRRYLHLYPALKNISV